MNARSFTTDKMKPIGTYRLTALLAGILTLGLVGAAGSAAAGAAQAPAGAKNAYLSLPLDAPPIYLPVVLKPLSTPVNLANGSFEADTVIDFTLPNNPCRYTGITDQP